MKLYDAYGDNQASLFGASTNSQTFANLPYSKALALLSVPENERESFAEEVHAEEISLRELKEEIRKREEERDRAVEDLDAAKEDIRDMSAQLDDAQTVIDRQADELDELRNRPVEVAVREPSEEELGAIVADRLKEVNEIHAQALASADAERQKAENDLVKARQDAKALKDKLKRAEEDHQKALEQERVKAAEKSKEDIRQLEESIAFAEKKNREMGAQLDAAEKKLAMSDASVVEFRLRFIAWQAAFSAVRDALGRVPSDVAGAMRSAVHAQLDAWGKEAL
jgi:chromosome segregation ATPase